MGNPLGDVVGDGGALAALPEGLFQHIEEISGFGTWIWDPATNRVAWSGQVHRIFGTDPAGGAPTFDSYTAMVHPDDRESLVGALRDTARVGGCAVVEHRIVRADGQVREIVGKVRAELDADGAVSYLAGSVQDVTVDRQAARELARARDLFAGVLDAATEQSIIGMDQGGLITVFNKGAERMLGYSAAELIGVSTPVLLHDPDELASRAAERGLPPDHRVIVGRAAEGRPETRRWTYLTKHGARLQAMVTATAIRDGGGTITGYTQVATDLTARYVAERTLQATEALFQDIFDNAASGIMLVDISDGLARMLRVNPAMCRITGYTEQQLLTMTVLDLTHPDSVAAANDRFREYFADGGAAPMETERRWIHADGRDIWVRLDISATWERSNSVIAMVEDITARKQAEDRLSHLALHDALTGLPNRRLLLDRLQHALDASSRSDRPVGLLYLDLDGFKAVNDEAGHLAGDEILQMVAQRLLTHVRPGDTVARMGGDEFVVVCPDLVDPADVEVVARRLLHHLALPYPLAGAVHHLSASIGMAASAPGMMAQTLVREADAAMYLAKTSGRNRIRSNRRAAAAPDRALGSADRVLIGAELRPALEREDYVLTGQPILDLHTGQVLAVSTTVAWQQSNRRELLSAQGADSGETALLIARRALEQSCWLAAGWPETDGYRPAVHVELTSRQLVAGRLADEVRSALAASGLPATSLVLELEARVLPQVAGRVLTDLATLRQLGVRIAADRVGTGEVSLDRLPALPIDVVQIDGTVTARLGKDVRSHALVKAVVGIGEVIGLQIVADGVDSTEQADVLCALGCRAGQGALYGAGRTPDELMSMLRPERRPLAGGTVGRQAKGTSVPAQVPRRAHFGA